MPKNWPAYNIYPGDYLGSVISTCSIVAQGIWFRMEILMHKSERYGHLTLPNGKAMPAEVVARSIGVPVSQYTEALEEMDDLGFLQRDRGVIFSLNLIQQDEDRSKARKRKQDFDEKRRGHKLLDSQDGGNAASNADDGVTNDVPEHRKQRSRSRTPSEEKRREEKGIEEKGREEFFSLQATDDVEALSEPDADPEPDLEPDPEALADALAKSIHATGPKLVTTQPVGQELNKGSSELIEEIALATPVALALRWTPLTVHGKHSVLMPIINAINLEMREQGLSEREASLWLLKQTRSVTEQVQQEGGWERYWTINRLGKFFEGTEYRNVKTFNRLVGGNGNGTVRGRSTAEINRETLAGLRAARGNEGRGSGGDSLPGGRGEEQAALSSTSGPVQSGTGGTDNGADRERDDERLTGTSNVPNRGRRTPAGFGI